MHFACYSNLGYLKNKLQAEERIFNKHVQTTDVRPNGLAVFHLLPVRILNYSRDRGGLHLWRLLFDKESRKHAFAANRDMNSLTPIWIVKRPKGRQRFGTLQCILQIPEFCVTSSFYLCSMARHCV